MRSRLLGVIGANVSRLEDLTRDLLDLSRIEDETPSRERAEVVLSSLIETLRTEFEPRLRERRLDLVARIAPGAGTLRSDRRLLLLILSNLVENAVKFAREGTSVIIASDLLDGAGVRVRVSDQGVGIPLEQQPRIFERFYQVDASRDEHAPRRGTGLGLAIVKHAVRALGGAIRVESVWQQGTTIIVDLPDAQNAG
jgi:two-component system phosphate regulon sensor histidine kinase PhoR